MGQMKLANTILNEEGMKYHKLATYNSIYMRYPEQANYLQRHEWIRGCVELGGVGDVFGVMKI